MKKAMTSIASRQTTKIQFMIGETAQIFLRACIFYLPLSVLLNTEHKTVGNISGEVQGFVFRTFLAFHPGIGLS